MGRYLYAIAVNSIAGLVDFTGSTWLRTVQPVDEWELVGRDLRLALRTYSEETGAVGLDPEDQPEDPVAAGTLDQAP